MSIRPSKLWFYDQKVKIYIEIQATEFLDSRRPPVEKRDEFDLSFRIEDQSVIIFELRKHMITNEMVELPIAKTTFTKVSKEWKVYWQRADLKWHRYDSGTVVKSFDEFLEIVHHDEDGCFWG